MADRLAAAVLIHFNSLKASCGIPASVTRGAATIEPTIVLGRIDGTAISTREALLTSDKQDILVSEADYADLGEPADGDTFTYDEAGKTVVVEARPSEQQDSCFYRWKGGAVFRVHCKVISRT